MAFVPVIRAFNDANISYVIVGGLATVLHGHLRVTADVDFVIRLEEGNILAALNALELLGYRARLPVDPRGFADETVRRSWIQEKGLMVLSFFNPADVVDSVDLFADYPIDFNLLLDRSVLKALGDVHARVCSIQDLIAIKRAAGRPIDQADVIALEAIRKGG